MTLGPEPANFPFTAALRDLILELARSPSIHSVSCPFWDFELWKGLLQEQVRRARVKGLPVQEAFYLSGPGGGLPGLTPIPYANTDSL